MRRTRIKTKRKAVPKEIREHWSRVASLGCCISGMPATIHHVHGGSIIEKFGSKAMPGMAQRQNHWLVIPLAPRYHTGDEGIDNGQGKYKSVAEWELAFGSQAYWLEGIRVIVWQRWGYDTYERAGLAAAVAANPPTACGDPI